MSHAKLFSPMRVGGHLGHLAMSGAALLTIEATAVLPESRVPCDPRWSWHAAAHFGAQVNGPPQCFRSQPRQHPDPFRLPAED